MTDWYGSRVEDVTVDLLTIHDVPAGSYRAAAPTISLDRSIYDAVRVGGKMDFVDDGSVDWLDVRVKVTYWVDGVAYSRGVFIPATPTGARSALGAPRSVELYDKNQVLREDVTIDTYVVDVGTVVTDAVAALITGTGETRMTVQPSPLTVQALTTWAPGTEKLKIANDLLASINYSPLSVDPDGAYQIYPYPIWTARPVEWVFDDGQYTGLYLDDFDDVQDLYSVPNRWLGISRSNGTDPSLTSVKTNEDPSSPFSYSARGRWITKVSTGVEAADQATLDAITQRNLTDATGTTRKFTIKHPWLPIDLESVVVLKNAQYGISSKCRIVKMTEDLSLPGVLMTSTLYEIGPA